MERHLNFARNLHIETRILEGDDVASTLVDFGRRNQVTQIFLTRPASGRLVAGVVPRSGAEDRRPGQGYADRDRLGSRAGDRIETLPDEHPQRRVRLRVVLFLFSAILILLTFNALSSVSNTLDRLNVVEAERDRWQRPAEVLRALGLSPGSTVVDLGSGAGYFTLKLAAVVGRQGEVLAVDLRRLSLFFLRIRALMRNQHNIDIIVGAPDDPHLPTGRVDAVLISNTYHEFSNRRLMLDHTWRSLRRGGRLVLVDRGPPGAREKEVDSVAPGHEVSIALVEAELREKGFEILRRDDRFIGQPGDEPWWLIVARRP